MSTLIELCSTTGYTTHSATAIFKELSALVLEGRLSTTSHGHDMTEIGVIAEYVTFFGKPEPKAKEARKPLNEEVYAVEHICGGPDAAGGGCGAPGGISQVSEKYFSGMKGSVFYAPQEHRDDEIPQKLRDAWRGGYFSLKINWAPCRSCLQH